MPRASSPPAASIAAITAALASPGLPSGPIDAAPGEQRHRSGDRRRPAPTVSRHRQCRSPGRARSRRRRARGRYGRGRCRASASTKSAAQQRHVEIVALAVAADARATVPASAAPGKRSTIEYAVDPGVLPRQVLDQRLRRRAASRRAAARLSFGRLVDPRSPRNRGSALKAMARLPGKVHGVVVQITAAAPAQRRPARPARPESAPTPWSSCGRGIRPRPRRARSARRPTTAPAWRPCRARH